MGQSGNIFDVSKQMISNLFATTAWEHAGGIGVASVVTKFLFDFVHALVDPGESGVGPSMGKAGGFPLAPLAGRGWPEAG